MLLVILNAITILSLVVSLIITMIDRNVGLYEKRQIFLLSIVAIVGWVLVIIYHIETLGGA